VKSIEQFILKNYKIAILSAVFVGWTFVKDSFIKGADATMNEIIDARFKHNMENPIILMQVLKSQEVSDFAIGVSDEIYKDLEAKAHKEDSISKAETELIGKELGIRNEDVLPLQINQLRDYKEGNFLTEEEYKDRTERRNIRVPRF